MGEQPDYPDGIYHDLLPIDDTHGRSFVLDHGRLSVFDGTATPTVRDLWELKWTEREADRCAAGFAEPFVVRGSAEDGYTFVTESGDVYFSPTPVGKAKRKVHAVWSDRYQPVRVLITDNGSGKTFAFTRPAYPKDEDGDKNAVFFELGPDPDPKPYKLPEAKVKFLPEAVKDVSAYAAFLLDQGLVKP